MAGDNLNNSYRLVSICYVTAALCFIQLCICYIMYNHIELSQLFEVGKITHILQMEKELFFFLTLNFGIISNLRITRILQTTPIHPSLRVSRCYLKFGFV